MERYLEFAVNHYILSLALIVVSYLLIQDLLELVFKKFNAISPQQAVTKINQGDTIIIDVREAAEFKQKQLENAINAPLSTLTECVPELVEYKNKPVLIMCESGNRSASAARILSKAGFADLFVITGGMQAWETDYKLPVKLGRDRKTKA